MAIRLSQRRGGCKETGDRASGLLRGVSSALGIKGVDDIMEGNLPNKRKEDDGSLLVESFTASDPVSREEFKGSLKPGILYKYETGNAGAKPLICGLCPLCGVMNLWMNIAVQGPSDSPTVYPMNNGKIQEEAPADMTCNCVHCKPKFRIVEGKVERVG